MVSKVFDALTGDPHLVAGAEVSHWNGSPIALAVARHAELEAGSNPAARMARGLENMTLRTISMSPPPDEDWVDLRYTVDGSVFETRIPWRVFDSMRPVLPFSWLLQHRGRGHGSTSASRPDLAGSRLNRPVG
jgi:hypothetical protein